MHIAIKNFTILQISIPQRLWFCILEFQLSENQRVNKPKKRCLKVLWVSIWRNQFHKIHICSYKLLKYAHHKNVEDWFLPCFIFCINFTFSINLRAFTRDIITNNCHCVAHNNAAKPSLSWVYHVSEVNQRKTTTTREKNDGMIEYALLGCKSYFGMREHDCRLSDSRRCMWIFNRIFTQIEWRYYFIYDSHCGFQSVFVFVSVRFIPLPAYGSR